MDGLKVTIAIMDEAAKNQVKKYPGEGCFSRIFFSSPGTKKYTDCLGFGFPGVYHLFQTRRKPPMPISNGHVGEVVSNQV